MDRFKILAIHPVLKEGTCLKVPQEPSYTTPLPRGLGSAGYTVDVNVSRDLCM